MARFEMNGMDELINQLENMADLSETALKMIDAATPTIEKNLAKNIHAAANRGYATGELEKSVHSTKAKQNNYGYFAAVGVIGTDSKGVRNGEKLAYLEYGTTTQDAHPVMAKTVNESEKECIEKMQEVFEQEVSG